MTEMLDRKLQLEILKTLAQRYPNQAKLDGERIEGDPITYNAAYLHEHGLIEACIAKTLNAPAVVIGGTITAKGLDFLADDGGLSAMLGVLTIKLHEDQLLHLLERRIEAAPGSQTDKNGLIAQLRALRGESIKHVTMKLLDLGLEKAPNAIQLLQTALESALK